MNRCIVGGAGVLMLAGLAALGDAGGSPASPRADEALAAKLERRFDFPGIDNPDVTLQKALEQLAKQFGFAFDFNDKAFRSELISNVRETRVAITAIPPAKNVRLETVLRRVLDRCEVASGATFTLRRDFVEITTRRFQAAQVWGIFDGPHLPLVHLNADKRPLDESLQNLAEQAEFNVVLDPRAGDRGHAPVSCRMTNTPVDTAVRLLADAAGLESFQLDNVFYVTTRENAVRWRARLRTEKGRFKEGQPDGPLRRARWRTGIGIQSPPVFIDLDE